jgi:hypothetical protein
VKYHAGLHTLQGTYAVPDLKTDCCLIAPAALLRGSPGIKFAPLCVSLSKQHDMDMASGQHSWRCASSSQQS